MKVAVINVSNPHYNLGAAKLSNWLRADGHEVVEFQGDPGLFLEGFDRVCLSVIFTWDAPIAREIAWRVEGKSEVWAGGPGLFKLADWWKRETGLNSVIGLDQRFENQPGEYRMTFAARGCPVGCHFCIVPQLEGKRFTLNWGFTPAPILCDNNLSALPPHFQDHILTRYEATGTRLMDANSGFEPRFFDHATYYRWRGQLRGPWRFAFDMMPEWRSVRNTCRILATEATWKKQVYVLVGNEPIESCYERCMKVIEWGAQPYCQPEIALDSLDKRPKVRHDWTEGLLADFSRYFNRHLWHNHPITEYMPRKMQRNPFAELVIA